MNIVLIEPEIPQNTGNIVRTCAATGAKLHLVRPLGFDISEKAVRRAGLDYWSEADIKVYDCIEDFFARNNGNYFFATTKAKHSYAEVSYTSGDYLIFGKETHGLPEPLLIANYERCIRIPMRSRLRSLNLSNAVAVVLYEALRQNGFANMETEGCLTGRAD